MFEDSMFPVTKSKVFTLDPRFKDMPVPDYLIPIDNNVAIVREDNQHVLSVMSKDYHPVSDMDVLTRFLETFQEENIQVVPIKHHITKAKDGVLGRTTYMEVELPDFSLFAGTREEQRCRIIIPNSYNGTEALSFRLVFWRLVCLNGMMGWKEDFSMKIKHRKGADAKIQDAIQMYLNDNIWTTTQKIEALGNASTDRDSVITYLQNNRVLVGERWSEQLMGHWLREGTPTNLWQIYNIFTNEITHNYGRNYGVKLNKMEALNRDVETVWQRVLNAPDISLIGGNA